MYVSKDLDFERANFEKLQEAIRDNDWIESLRTLI